MENLEFFNSVDSMLCETLSKKSLEELQNELIDTISNKRGGFSNNFKTSLDFGEQGELVFRKFLENKGYIFLSDCKDITSDQTYLKDGKEWIFELKTDSRHMHLNENGILIDTGNVVFEYTSRGNPSGYMATKAEFFVTYFPQINEIWLIRTRKLKNIINENKYNFKDILMGDKGSQTRGNLISRDIIRNEFKVESVC